MDTRKPRENSVKHNTTQAQFEAVLEAVDKTRGTSKTVKVSKVALINLLMDHSEMSHRLEGLEK